MKFCEPRRVARRCQLTLLSLFLLLACKKEQPTSEAPRPAAAEFPVQVERLATQRVEYAITAPGAVEAFENVQVTARVAGAVDKVAFREGEAVKQGALLVAIDPARFQLAVAQAQAAVEQATAARAEAERELERSQKLVAEGVANAMDVSNWQTKLASAKGAEAQARAALGAASLNLRDARVKAPISGVMQTRSVQTGQFVQPGTVLATLIQDEPLLLRFKVQENEASRLAVGQVVNFRVKDRKETHEARITLVAAAAESASRMVPVVAEVGASGRGVRPGTFAEVSVRIGEADAVTVPETAIRPSDRGFLAFVVEGKLARERVLGMGLRTADGRVEVRSGVRAGELVVVRGAEALRDGASVRTATPSGAAPAGSGG